MKITKQAIYMKRILITIIMLQLAVISMNGQTKTITRQSTSKNAAKVSQNSAKSSKNQTKTQSQGKQTIQTSQSHKGHQTSQSRQSQSMCPDNNHPHAIDLGLPSGTKWACCNVGAKKPEADGNYYAWAEIEPKTNYSEKTYAYHNDKGQYYVFESDIEGTEVDVAHVTWKGSWRLPTKEEWEELSSNCYWKWTNKEGHYGYLVTSSKGKSIFLPAAGGYVGNKVSYTEMGLYWSSRQIDGFVDGAYGLHFNSSGKGWGDGSFRWQGHTVRPVFGK